MARAPFYEKKPLKKGTWSPDEDQMLKAYIKKYGIWNWSEMPGPAGLSRSGKSCRLRWMNYLRPDIKHGNFSREEEETILKLHEELGNKWSAIAARLPRRTDNEIKNYWHTHLKKCLKASLAPKTELQEAKTSSLEANQQNSSKIDLVLPNPPKATNSEDSYTTPLSSSSPAVYIDKNQALNEIIGSSGSLGELQSLWELSFPMEDLYLVEDSNASKATNSEDSYATPLSTSSPDFYFDKNQALNENICSFESLGVLQSSWEQSFPMEDYYVVEEYSNAPKATTSEDSYSTPLSTSSLDVCIDKNQASSEIIGSSESLGVLQSLWEHSFPAEDLFMVEDYGAKYTDPGFIAPFSPMWLQDPSNDFWVNCFMQENMNGI